MGALVSGYSSEQVADLIQSAVARYMSRERGSVASSGVLLDLEGGWERVSRRTRLILSAFVFDGTPPPSIDIEAAREVIKAKHELGHPHHAESREVREAMSVNQLGRQMNRHRNTVDGPILVFAGKARRGRCETCGRWNEGVWVYWHKGKSWCQDHQPGTDAVPLSA